MDTLIVNAILKMDNPGIIAGAFYLFKKHDDLKHLTGDIAYILCISLHHRVSNEIFGAQKLKGAWMIRLKSLISKTSLLQQEAIIINDIRVPIYGSNPLDRTSVQTERVNFRDFPMHESSDNIIDYLSTLPQIVHSGNVQWSYARDHNNQSSIYTNGDRFIDVLADFCPPLPKEVMIANCPVRIWHATQKDTCMRCQKANHFTGDVMNCEASLSRDQQKHIMPFKSPMNVG